jgi:two-component system chemotaxis sensor kinase CheA
MTEPAKANDSPSDQPDAELRKAVVQTFLVEAEERLTEMEQALVALERRPDDEDLVQAIFRGAHTLKGNASTLDFPRLAEFAHAVEDLLQRFRSRTLPVTTDLVSLLLRGVDALRRMVMVAPSGRDDSDHADSDLLDRFRAASSQPAVSGRPSARGLPPATVARDSRPGDGVQDDAHHGFRRNRTLRIEIAKLDRLLDLAGEIAIAQGRLRQSLQRFVPAVGDEVLEAHRQVERLFSDLHEVILDVRMVPVGPLFRQYIRTVRDISHSLGKSARLVIEGENVEVDTTIVEYLKDPITHMIRNALDHGIEPPAVRTGKGKDAVGRITLRASHEGGHLVVHVEDDGAGLDRAKILKVAKAKGLVADHHARSDQETLRLIFEPGFSTSDAVTELSGRGVGMDVVRKNVDALRGSVAVESRKDVGTRITIRLPLTLAMIEGFAVGVADDTFVIPLGAVAECLELPADARGRMEASGVVDLRGEALPYLRLREFFGRTGPRPPRESLVVVRDQGNRAGFVVDALYGERQAVVKPLGGLFRGARGVSGATIMGSGRVALIVDVPSVLRRVHTTMPLAAA